MKKILVIDDEREVLEIVRTVLKTKGYTIRCAEGGEEGLRQAEADRPDLIICDLMMPRVSGLEVIKRLKKHQRLRTVPVIVLSAVGRDDSKPDDFWARGLGVDEYLNKPFDPLDLLGRVEFIFRRNDYVSTREETANFDPAEFADRKQGGAPPPRASDLQSATPVEVAKAYCESWNKQDFVTEFNTLDDELTGQMKLPEYVGRRMAAWQEEGGPNKTMKITKILEEKISGNVAKVVAEREDTVEGRAWRKKATYTMKKTFKGWKLIRYSELPMRKEPTGEDI